MEPVRWGVLGCARVFERRMVPGFATASGSAILKAVASRSAAKARAVAEKHNIERFYGDYAAVLDDPDIEAVYIPLPNDQHAAWTIRSLRAGKHVLCDKPAATTFEDAQSMAETARVRGLRLMEGFMYCHHPQHAQIADAVRRGEIGTPTHFVGTFTYAAAFDPANIRWSAAQGGGAFLDTGVYALDAARLHFGEPVAVSAAARTDPSTGVDWHTTVLLEWPDGRTGSLLGGFDQPFASRYEIRGDGGEIVAERAFQIGEAGITFVVRVGDVSRTETIPHVDQYGLEITHFSACVRDRAKPLAPGENGVAQARVVEAVRIAVKEQRRVLLAELSYGN